MGEMLRQEIQWQNIQNRSVAWLTRDGCSCVYKYGDTIAPPLRMEPWFLEITDAVCQVLGKDLRGMDMPNSCNINLYEDGHQSVGWHSDAENLFAALTQDTLII